MSSFFTRAGDDGTTSILGKGRLLKSDLRIETLGTIDELTAALGLARATCQSTGMASQLALVQRDLYDMMGEIAATPENAARFHQIDPERIRRLEEEIQALEKQVVVPAGFLLPGDSLGSAALDLARTVARRAERRVVELFERGDITNQEILRYLNRFSSLCYLLELAEIKSGGAPGPTLAKGSTTS